MGRTETRIDRALLDVVRERAAEQGRGEEELIEEAVRRYLNDEAEGTLGELLDGVAAWQKERGVSTSRTWTESGYEPESSPTSREGRYRSKSSLKEGERPSACARGRR